MGDAMHIGLRMRNEASEARAVERIVQEETQYLRDRMKIARVIQTVNGVDHVRNITRVEWTDEGAVVWVQS